MTGSTKILTVSYGTFSCTLEGFDDPFGTMRGIAEYFRDLAADDRYFGAEPPTPDVEMLQRIAEQEVHRRVEARMGETGVALTQASDVTTAADVATEDAEAVARVTSAAETAGPAFNAEESNLDSGPLTQDDDFLLSDEPEDVLSVDPDAHLTDVGPAETVAEKLRRIRAVVSRSTEEIEDPDPSFGETQAPTAEQISAEPKRDRALSDTIRQITEDLSDEGHSRNGFADIGDETEHEADAEVSVAEVVEASADEAVADDLSEAKPGNDEDDGSSDEANGGWDFDVEGLDAQTKSVEADDETEVSMEDTAESVARVISQLNGSAADDDTADHSEDELTETVAVSDDAPSNDVEEAAEATARTMRPSKPLTPITETGEGEDVGRIMAETDNHLNDDESVRRRRVISQMRAAVAATKADRLVSRRVSTPVDEAAAEQERYRDDLSEAVRHVSRSRPNKDGERPTSAAPLVLVSAQRVDDSLKSDLNAGEADLEVGAEIPDFAGFAKTMGATELPDLLEAAAAYSSFVEGQPSFTRPEIMKRVARIDPSIQHSREDGLRSFGQLLRQGKFHKLERGQFAIAETTRFKPEQRIAGE